jgi:molybdopterin-containing oxidoreductase family membrane subunit
VSRTADAAPIIGRGASLADVTDTVCDVVVRQRAPLWWWIAVALSGAFVVLLVVAASELFIVGIGTWGVNIPVAWGFALANYVWWIGIASGGTIISALFYLTGSEWRRATNRVAESMTLWGAACAGLMPIFHLGRQGLFYWLFPYPNVMGIWPQFRSPLLWDFFALICYIFASILFWYLGLVPDFASMRDRAPTTLWRVFYGLLALGWRGSASQWKTYQTVYGILACLLAPMVVSVHSIVGLDFSGGLVPGWHSLQFSPYFVFGAVYSGFATALLLMIPVRRLYHLETYITERHLNVLAKLMLVCGLMLTYSYALEAFMPFYSGNIFDLHMFLNRLYGHYGATYWVKIALNCALPQLLWFPAVRRSEILLMLLSLAIIVGMWVERYIIVVTSLYQDFMPSAWYVFAGTVWDWSILLGSVGLFFTGFLVVLRFVPIVSVSEMRETVHEHVGDRP